MTRFIGVIKRWWIVALVFTLALSLTSCAKRKKEPFIGDGLSSCEGNLGSFYIAVRPQGVSGLYQILVEPVGLDEPGDIAQITLVNGDNSYKPLLKEVVLVPNQVIYAGTVSEDDLDSYNYVDISLIDDTGAGYLDQAPEKVSTCDLPGVGEDLTE